ncbi:MAG: hypothetical protein ACKV2U_27335 [Bryobacteraceae bacterium]
MAKRRWIQFAILLPALCARAGEAEALAISANMQARHLPFGTVLDPFYASATSDQITGYTRCGDSALWTGHYLAAEAYRYQVTGSADALNNALKALDALKGLVDVTQTNLLARCRIAIGSPFAAGIHGEEAANGAYTNAAAGWTWIGNTSRDQYCGAIYGLGVAYSLIQQAAPQATIRDVVTRLVTFLIDNNWTAPMPDGRAGTSFLLRPDEQLAILQVARQVNPDRFAAVYETQRARLAGNVSTPVAFDSLSTSSYFKFNLIFITFFHLIRLEEDASRATYERAYSIARNYTAAHQNAFFNMIDRALFGADPRRDGETLALLDLWFKRPRRDGFVDHRGKVNTCGDQACQPIPVDQRTPTDFLWQRSPFQLFGGGTGTIGNAGIDYILPYWMARYYSVVSSFTAQSAAAAITALAPESIGSIYGPGLAQQTSAAGSPVESLGGVRLRITDSAGAERYAPLFYVSPTQINFLVPSGAANGLASLAVVQSDGSVLTASAQIQSVAPGLFTMNQRIAAATAIRVRNGVQAPVPVFTCTATQCLATPIELNENEPVYLTLYGTGLRRRQLVSAALNGVVVPVLYAGAQPSYAGLDQVNIELPANLPRSGEVEIVLTVDGQKANPVFVTVR